MTSNAEPAHRRTDWFVHDRFGLFIHWGLYALPARHEWVRKYERISNEEYEKYFKRFDPDLFDPKLWAAAATGAGMKYVVVTTKHHEGFCLWDTALTDYKAPNTPAQKDLLRPIVEAFRAEDMRIGLYYSLLDWHHPDYTVDACHPLCKDPDYVARDKDRNLQKYVEYVHAQTRELLTRFGRIDILFYDFSVQAADGFPGKGRGVWRSEELVRMVRQLQPNILINDRLDLPQDYFTPEQLVPTSAVQVDGKRVVWEGCHTLSGSWGYHRDEESWKSVEQLVKMLIDAVSKDGNLLLNVGPTGRGEFDERALDRLAGIGQWMKRHHRSIYGCTRAPEAFKPPAGCCYTYNPRGERLYLHFLSWPFKYVRMEGMADKVEYAQLLNDASEIKMLRDLKGTPNDGIGFECGSNDLILELPAKKPNAVVPVVEFFLRRRG